VPILQHSMPSQFQKCRSKEEEPQSADQPSPPRGGQKQGKSYQDENRPSPYAYLGA